MSQVHELKTWPVFFDAIVRGEKTFELRKNDRGFQAGDTLHLREWDPERKWYSGRIVRRKVTFLLADRPGLESGYVVMSIERVS